MYSLDSSTCRRVLVPLFVLLVLAAACGFGDRTANDPLVAGTVSPEADAAAAAFPVTVGDGDAAVEITTRPERIVSLSPTATEILFAVGAGDQVVAVDDQSDYPPDVPTTDLSGFQPNVEAVAAYEPDLVIASGDPGGLVDGLDTLDIPTLLHPSAPDLATAYSQINDVGAATGHAHEAAALVADMRRELDALADEVADLDTPTTYYHELDPNLFSASSDTFIGEVYGLFGMTSIADAAEDQNGGYPQLSPEYIVEADPQAIFVTDRGATPDEIAARPGWDAITAVQNEAITSVDVDLASRWGPRVVDFARAVADALATTAPER